jgi:hypothetical protein
MFLENLRLKLISFYEWVIDHSKVFFFFAFIFFSFAFFHAVNEYKENKSGLRQSIAIKENGIASNPLIVLNLRGDNAIPLNMREAVNCALNDIDRVSCGLAHVNVVWNYDNKWDFPNAVLHGESVIQGMSILNVETSLGRSDSDILLGMTRTSKNHDWSPVWIFLINEKLEDNTKLAEWTALHEIGHALGMDHVKHGLMEPNAPRILGTMDRPEWALEDQIEFCRIYKCDPNVFANCTKK